MGSHSPPKDSFDSADIENIEEAFKAICATLMAHNPAGAAGLHDSLKLQIRRTLFALVRVSGLIVEKAMDRYYALLQGLAAVSANLFTVINTRKTLTPNTDQPLGWANEIHPIPLDLARSPRRF